jgi:hypothetical protein
MSLPDSIRLANASGLTVRVTILDGEYANQSVVVFGVVTEDDAVAAVLRQIPVTEENCPAFTTEVL